MAARKNRRRTRNRRRVHRGGGVGPSCMARPDDTSCRDPTAIIGEIPMLMRSLKTEQRLLKKANDSIVNHTKEALNQKSDVKKMARLELLPGLKKNRDGIIEKIKEIMTNLEKSFETLAEMEKGVDHSSEKQLREFESLLGKYEELISISSESKGLLLKSFSDEFNIEPSDELQELLDQVEEEVKLEKKLAFITNLDHEILDLRLDILNSEMAIEMFKKLHYLLNHDKEIKRIKGSDVDERLLTLLKQEKPYSNVINSLMEGLDVDEKRKLNERLGSVKNILSEEENLTGMSDALAAKQKRFQEMRSKTSDPSSNSQGGGSYPDGCMDTHHAAWHFNGGNIGGMPEYSAGYPQGGGGYGSSSSGLQYTELSGGGSCGGGDHPHTTPMAGGMRRRNKKTRGRRTQACDCDICDCEPCECTVKSNRRKSRRSTRKKRSTRRTNRKKRSTRRTNRKNRSTKKKRSTRRR